MSGELIGSIHKMRHEWALALDDPTFDATKLQTIRQNYQRGLRMDKVYHALYEQERAAFLADLETHRAACRALAAVWSKEDLARKIGYTESQIESKPFKRTTRDHLLATWMSFQDDQVENEHTRVQRKWAAMTQGQREGWSEPVWSETEYKRAHTNPWPTQPAESDHA